MEVFRKIEGYDNKYSVSNMSNVRKDSTCKILKQSHLQYGDDHYEVVSLYKDGKYEKVQVCKLVADEFVTNKIVFDNIIFDDINNKWRPTLMTEEGIIIKLEYCRI